MGLVQVSCKPSHRIHQRRIGLRLALRHDCQDRPEQQFVVVILENEVIKLGQNWEVAVIVGIISEQSSQPPRYRRRKDSVCSTLAQVITRAHWEYAPLRGSDLRESFCPETWVAGSPDIGTWNVQSLPAVFLVLQDQIGAAETYQLALAPLVCHRLSKRRQARRSMTGCAKPAPLPPATVSICKRLLTNAWSSMDSQGHHTLYCFVAGSPCQPHKSGQRVCICYILAGRQS